MDWAGLVLNILGCVLNARKNIWCWPVWLLANALWTAHWIMHKEPAALVMILVYSCLNVYGYFYWRKKEDNENDEPS